MKIRQIVPNSLRDKVPVTTRIRANRLLDDLPTSFAFGLNRAAQREALRDFTECTEVPDYFKVAQKWLGTGPIQIEEEITEALDHIQHSAPETVCEIGTDNGGTTLLLGSCLESVRHVVGVDLYVKNKRQLRLLRKHGQQIDLIEGSSHDPGTFKRVQDLLGLKKIDLLLIDGDHSYEGVEKDFLLYRTLVRDDGQIMFHDIVEDHGQRFGRATLASSGGVPKFWNHIKRQYDYQEFVADPEQDGMGIGLIRYSSKVNPH